MDTFWVGKEEEKDKRVKDINNYQLKPCGVVQFTKGAMGS